MGVAQHFGGDLRANRGSSDLCRWLMCWSQPLRLHAYTTIEDMRSSERPFYRLVRRLRPLSAWAVVNGSDHGVGEICELGVFFRFRVAEPPERSMSKLLLLGGSCVTRHLFKRGVPSHGGDLVGRTSGFSKPSSSRFS